MAVWPCQCDESQVCEGSDLDSGTEFVSPSYRDRDSDTEVLGQGEGVEFDVESGTECKD